MDETDQRYQVALAAVNALLSVTNTGLGSFLPANQAALTTYSSKRDAIAAGYAQAVASGDDALRQRAADAMESLAEYAQANITPQAIKDQNLAAADDTAADFGVSYFGQGFTSAPFLGGAGLGLSFPSLSGLLGTSDTVTTLLLAAGAVALVLAGVGQ